MPGKSKKPTVWTIGHSTRTAQEFLDLLTHYRIETIVDVRSLPGSRKYPQYNQQALILTLAAHGIDYHWAKSLGGRRRAHPDSPNSSWRNASFRGYADCMSSPEFSEGLSVLKHLADHSRTALMCAEAVWWRCHRSMIADVLCVDGTEVFHIMDARHSPLHPMTSPARIVNGQLKYALPPTGDA